MLVRYSSSKSDEVDFAMTLEWCDPCFYMLSQASKSNAQLIHFHPLRVNFIPVIQLELHSVPMLGLLIPFITVFRASYRLNLQGLLIRSDLCMWISFCLQYLFNFGWRLGMRYMHTWSRPLSLSLYSFTASAIILLQFCMLANVCFFQGRSIRYI